MGLMGPMGRKVGLISVFEEYWYTYSPRSSHHECQVGRSELEARRKEQFLEWECHCVRQRVQGYQKPCWKIVGWSRAVLLATLRHRPALV